MVYPVTDLISSAVQRRSCIIIARYYGKVQQRSMADQWRATDKSLTCGARKELIVYCMRSEMEESHVNARNLLDSVSFCQRFLKEEQERVRRCYSFTPPSPQCNEYFSNVTALRAAPHTSTPRSYPRIYVHLPQSWCSGDWVRSGTVFPLHLWDNINTQHAHL